MLLLWSSAIDVGSYITLLALCALNVKKMHYGAALFSEDQVNYGSPDLFFLQCFKDRCAL